MLAAAISAVGPGCCGALPCRTAMASRGLPGLLARLRLQAAVSVTCGQGVVAPSGPKPAVGHSRSTTTAGLADMPLPLQPAAAPTGHPVAAMDRADARPHMGGKGDGPPAAALEGSVRRVRFHSDDTGYTVLDIRGFEVGHQDGNGGISSPSGFPDTYTAVGYLGNIREGQSLRLEGQWVENERYGRQLQVVRMVENRPRSEPEIIRYLEEGAIAGVGPQTARLLVSEFGSGTLDALDQDNAIPRLQQIKGIGKKKATKIKEEWDKDRWGRAAMFFLQEHGVGKQAASQLVKRHGKNTEEFVRRDPWEACDGIPGWSFPAIEELAQRVEADLGLPSRARAALCHVLRSRRIEGDCYLPWELLAANAEALLQEPPDAPAALDACLDDRLRELVDRGRLVMDSAAEQESVVERRQSVSNDCRVYLSELHKAECIVASLLRSRMQSVDKPGLEARVDSWMDRIESEGSFVLLAQQRQAIQAAASSRVLILTGGPGCGKTSTTKFIVNLWTAMNSRVKLCAPTGMAAKRLSQATEREAKTIHSMLRPTPNLSDTGHWHFQHDATNPLEVDAICVDEASMLDVQLAAALMKAIPSWAHLLLVGDMDQLPPVGPGHILQDSINSGKVPVIRLSEVLRQVADSAIVTNAHSIKDGDMPDFERVAPHNGSWWQNGLPLKQGSEQRPAWKARRNGSPADFSEAIVTECLWIEVTICLDDNFVLLTDAQFTEFRRHLIEAAMFAFWQVPDVPEVIMTALQEAMQSLFPQHKIDPVKEVQLLTPSNKGPLGTTALNKMLQALLNPAAEQKAELRKGPKDGGIIFREGDRVIQMKNDTSREIVNGDIGTVTRVDVAQGTVEVTFTGCLLVEETTVSYSSVDLDDLRLAWLMQAITIHKSQGSEYSAVIIPMSKMHGRNLLSRKLLYTALTRARNLVVLVGAKAPIRDAIGNLNERTRFTHLKHRLMATDTS
eukprot:SM000019S05080  [mRNA]  locus=s19:831021:836161:+ [translate_table: standard]